MKKFRFRLERLLEVRRRKTLLAREVLQWKMRLVSRVESRVAAREGEIGRLVSDVVARITQSPTAADAVAALGALRDMQEALERDRIELDRIRAEADAAKQVVQKRHQDTRVVETLKDKAKARHKVDTERETGKIVDDLALGRAWREA